MVRHRALMFVFGPLWLAGAGAAQVSPASAALPSALEQDAGSSAVVGEVAQQAGALESGVGPQLDAVSPERLPLTLDAVSVVRDDIEAALPAPPVEVLALPVTPPLPSADPLRSVQPSQRREQPVRDGSAASGAPASSGAPQGGARPEEGDEPIDGAVREPRAAKRATPEPDRDRSDRAPAAERPGGPADRAVTPAEFPRRDRDIDQDESSVPGVAGSGIEGSSAGGGVASGVLWHVATVSHEPEQLALLAAVARPRDGPAGEPEDRPG